MMLPIGYAATPEITSFSVVPNKAGYYIGETPQVLVKFTYKGFNNNTALKIEIYNSTGDLCYTITGITVVSSEATTNLNGTYKETHSLASNFTEEKGSETYTAKLIDVSSGYKLAETTFTINVQVESIMISVAWLDANQDREIEPNEQVTFSIFVQWVFVNESKSATLYAKHGGNEYVVTSLTISVGSGQNSSQYTAAFTKGEHTVTFELRDSENTVLASQSVTLKVGVEEAGLVNLVEQNLPWVALLLLLVVVIVVVVKRKK